MSNSVPKFTISQPQDIGKSYDCPLGTIYMQYFEYPTYFLNYNIREIVSLTFYSN